ncbi:hypothetical protein EDD11_004866 [Mortierella claussenii]|nr:hypothetical protein EDD11_004866 [Mortierella claussenii]
MKVIKGKQPSTPPDSLDSDPFARYTYERILDLSYFHSEASVQQRQRRTIIVGDIHGSLEGFEGFLHQIGFHPESDNLILAGDLVTKGPQSLEVIDKARALDAQCVRGNHDDKVIRWKGYLDSLNTTQRQQLEMDSRMRPDMPDDENAPNNDADQPQIRPHEQLVTIPADLRENSEHHKLAKSMTEEQYQYLVSCPLLLRLPQELSVHKVPVYVVHAGIDPRFDLRHQQPWVMSNIRSILRDGTPTRKKVKGREWAREFNDVQGKIMTGGGNMEDSGFMLVYGHDAGRSLSVRYRSIGLDTGCVYGKSLSGYVVETGQILSIPCPDHKIESDED